MKAARLKEWTYEEFMALPESKSCCYELIEGDLYLTTPSPVTWHQEISGNLFEIIRQFLRTNPLGKVYASPVDVVFSQEPLQVVLPDLVFVATERVSLITEKNLQGVPDLLVEILSPTTSLRDRREKLALDERVGVPEYWIVDPERNSVQVFRLSGERYGSELEFGLGDRLETPLLPGLSIPLSEFFPA